MPVDRREKLVWTQEFDIDLVNFIYSRRFLWDSSHPKYRNRYLRHKTFSEFAEGLDGDYTADGVKERWVNIRSVYSNIVRRVAVGSRAGRPYEPVWHLWGPCAFLDSVRRPRSAKVADPPSEAMCEQKPDCGLSSSGDDLPIRPRRIPDCVAALSELERLLSPERLEYLRAPQTLPSTHSFSNIGHYVTEKLVSLKPSDAECATQKIIDILLLYDELNPENPNSLAS